MHTIAQSQLNEIKTRLYGETYMEVREHVRHTQSNTGEPEEIDILLERVAEYGAGFRALISQLNSAKIVKQDEVTNECIDS